MDKARIPVPGFAIFSLSSSIDLNVNYLHGHEQLGVRFQIDSDILPDGPDWWTTDDWKSVVAQSAKMRMNFIGLHTYPSTNKDLGPEPTVWIGLPEDVLPDGTAPDRNQTVVITG